MEPLYPDLRGTDAELKAARTPLPDTQTDPQLRDFLEGLPPRYLRTHTQDEIQGHLRLEQQSREKGVAASLTKSAAWVLDVVADDRPFLFASIAATLSGLGLNILKAEAFSNAHGKAIDRFTFADPTRTLDLNPDEAESTDAHGGQGDSGRNKREPAPRQTTEGEGRRARIAAASTSFDNEASPSADADPVETTQDRPALLYDLASAISRSAAGISRVSPGRYGSEEGHRRLLHHEGQCEAERSGCSRDDGRFGRDCAFRLACFAPDVTLPAVVGPGLRPCRDGAARHEQPRKTVRSTRRFVVGQTFGSAAGLPPGPELSGHFGAVFQWCRRASARRGASCQCR